MRFERASPVCLVLAQSWQRTGFDRACTWILAGPVRAAGSTPHALVQIPHGARTGYAWAMYHGVICSCHRLILGQPARKSTGLHTKYWGLQVRQNSIKLVKLMTHLVDLTTPDDPQYFVCIPCPYESHPQLPRGIPPGIRADHI